VVRGAAGAAVLNAELLATRGFFKSRVDQGQSVAEEVSK
jgi:hypothetical protein